MDGGAEKRIFVKVFGFSDVERHALNTVFRLSESRPVRYALWTEEVREKAQVALVDGDSWEATVELANPGNDQLKLIWLGDRPSATAALVFSRPLQWADILQGLDGLYGSPAAAALPDAEAPTALDFDVSAPLPLDIDVDLDVSVDGHGADADTMTEPAALDAEGGPHGERVLVVEADLAARLYIRAKLANSGLLLIDEAVNGPEALAFMASHAHVLALVDVGIAGMDGWNIVGHAARHVGGAGHVVVMRDRLGILDKWRARFTGAKAALAKPLHPRELKRLLASIGRPLRHQAP